MCQPVNRCGQVLEVARSRLLTRNNTFCSARRRWGVEKRKRRTCEPTRSFTALKVKRRLNFTSHCDNLEIPRSQAGSAFNFDVNIMLVFVGFLRARARCPLYHTVCVLYRALCCCCQNNMPVRGYRISEFLFRCGAYNTRGWAGFEFIVAVYFRLCNAENDSRYRNSRVADLMIGL